MINVKQLAFIVVTCSAFGGCTSINSYYKEPIDGPVATLHFESNARPMVTRLYENERCSAERNGAIVGYLDAFFPGRPGPTRISANKKTFLEVKTENALGAFSCSITAAFVPKAGDEYKVALTLVVARQLCTLDVQKINGEALLPISDLEMSNKQCKSLF